MGTPEHSPGHRPFTPIWASAYAEAINASEAYRAAGQGWRWPLALVLDPAPEHGYPDRVTLLADLHDGACRDMQVHVADLPDAPFVLRGTYAAWKQLLVEGGDPVTAIVRGQLRLTGALTTVIRFVAAARALVRCAQIVPTHFPDDDEGDTDGDRPGS